MVELVSPYTDLPWYSSAQTDLFESKRRNNVW